MPIAAIVNGIAYAVHSDHLNTPRKLTQADGQVAWQWAYSAFGDERPTLGAKRFTSETTTPTTGSTPIPEVTFNLRYPGQYYDKESNLHYNYFRSYSAERGRYTQADPIGLDGGFNRFGYVGGDALSGSDPTGLDCRTAHGVTSCAYPNGPVFNIPAQPGFPDLISPWHPLHHAYNVAQPMGQAGSQCVDSMLANNPTPGNPRPATLNGTLNNAQVGNVVNWVTSYLTTDLRTGGQLVVNVTGPASVFGPGYVARVVEGGVVHTYGEGTHFVQSFLIPSLVKTVANELVWGRQMNKFVNDCTCKR